MLASQRNAPLELFSTIKTAHNLNSYATQPLHVAVHFGHTDIAVHLIELGADVSHWSRGALPLHIAAEHGHTELASLLIKYGASVNEKDRSEDLPLHIAVKNGHTELSVLLIKHGASVNQKDRFGDLPLYIAAEHDHTDLALSLIKHGASVSHTNGDTGFALSLITFYINKVSKDAEHFDDDILTKLIPQRNVDIHAIFCKILSEEKHNLDVLSHIFHKLIQHLILAESLSITIRYRPYDYSFEMELNEDFIIEGRPLKNVHIYLCSVLVILLRCNILVVNTRVPPSFQYSGISAGISLQAHTTIDLLNAYKRKQTVKKLQMLCIWKARQSMYSRSDASFHSLPVPPSLQKMLMLQDIADVLYKGYKMWPQRMSIEELM